MIWLTAKKHYSRVTNTVTGNFCCDKVWSGWYLILCRIFHLHSKDKTKPGCVYCKFCSLIYLVILHVDVNCCRWQMSRHLDFKTGHQTAMAAETLTHRHSKNQNRSLTLITTDSYCKVVFCDLVFVFCPSFSGHQ